jgi:hypothetical protein
MSSPIYRADHTAPRAPKVVCVPGRRGAPSVPRLVILPPSHAESRALSPAQAAMLVERAAHRTDYTLPRLLPPAEHDAQVLATSFLVLGSAAGEIAAALDLAREVTTPQACRALYLVAAVSAHLEEGDVEEGGPRT